MINLVNVSCGVGEVYKGCNQGCTITEEFLSKQLAVLICAICFFQDLFIPITFRTAEGSLHAIPEKFLFEKVFPVSNLLGFSF